MGATTSSTYRAVWLWILVGVAFFLGMALWSTVGDYYEITEPWDEPEPRRAWRSWGVAIAFVLGIGVTTWRSQSAERGEKPPYRLGPLFAPVAIGEAIAMGSLVAMIHRSGEATFLLIGLTLMVVYYGALFGCSAFAGALVHWVIAWLVVRSKGFSR